MTVSSGRQQRRAVLVREYLAVHLTEPITLRETGRQLGLSESTIRRSLSATWAIGFHILLERLRVERALMLLAEDPESKIEAVALSIGWRSRSNLYASVRRVTGCSLGSLRADFLELGAARQRLSVSTAESPTQGATVDIAS